jgi:hypothetical protein
MQNECTYSKTIFVIDIYTILQDIGVDDKNKICVEA